MATGEIEVQVTDLAVISRSTPLPFQLDEEGVDETLRIRYRWLDLRRERLQRNIRTRAQLTSIIRQEMERDGFVDIETPIMGKPTPEGARDFLVPTRLQPGRFFALPQSPQIYKQLLVIAGFERYYQIARCFRDEDLRADRLQELTQLDVEMAFPDVDYLFALIERVVARVWRECAAVELETPFPRIPWEEADRRYGSDKPDLRFGLEIQDATELTRGSEFGVFANAPVVRFLRVPREFSRADLQRLEDVAKEWGAKGLAYLVYAETREVRSPIAKFLSEAELEALGGEPGTTLLFVADTKTVVERVLGALRSQLGDELDLIDRSRDEFAWVVDFPLFEWKEDEQRWTFSHHPFTGMLPGHEDLIESDPGNAVSLAYDLVWNGWELGSGSIRIHRSDIQQRVLRALGLSDEEIQEKFGFLLEVMRMGPPPHGGFALGIERFVALLAGESNIREIVAFPKTASGSEPMTGAPTTIPESVLAELGIRTITPN
jgi:aspartyl-tRNA synthetase